jgi:O-antigen/teichoic acid export membrane protein
MMPVFAILNNLLIAWRVRSIFPQYKAKGKLDAGDVRGIRKLVAGTFIQSACAVTRNSLDSICISAFLGLVLTGVYNNYFLVMSGVNAFVGLITVSFMGGVGNHVATRDVEENYQEMKRLDFIYLWIGGWCMICLLCLYQPFMKLWMGEDMLLPMSAVGLICLYFYLLKLGE